MERRNTAENKTQSPQFNYFDLFWLFIFGSVAGFLIEGVWSVMRFGGWMNHSATVWGPFCVVYGAGMVAIYLLARWLAKYPMIVKFALFCLCGALIEFLCGYLQTLIFHSRSWDYGGAFYGYINLEMTLIWGIMGLICSYGVVPLLDKYFIGKFSTKAWRGFGVAFTLFMLLNFTVTSLAVWRWHARLQGDEAHGWTAHYLDAHYGDARMVEIFPNMEFQPLDK